MTIDEEGMLWIAQYGGSCVYRWNPHTAEQLQKIDLPASKVTSCAFGGPNLDTLYITTATENMSGEELASEPEAGGLFATQPGIRGVPAVPFAG
jgi:sugar lactone lactonase YvrE